MRSATISIQTEVFDTPTGRAILEALPLESIANVWGDEIYFEIPVQLDPKPDARQDVAVGDLGYWPRGPAFCIFFGPTPVSRGPKPRAYSPVNVFDSELVGDAKDFKSVPDGAQSRVDRIQSDPVSVSEKLRACIRRCGFQRLMRSRKSYEQI